MPGLEVQQVWRPEGRMIVIRQRVQERPQAGRRLLLAVPGDKFQALWTNLPAAVPAEEAWRRYNGRADVENRIKEIGTQFGLKGLCCRAFWATEAACHLALCADNLGVLLQRRLRQPVRAELGTLRRRVFACAAVFRRQAGRCTLKLAVRSAKGRAWWTAPLPHFAAPAGHCHAVAAFAARAGPYQLIPTSNA